MELNRTHRKNLAVFYFCCFLISYCWLFFNGWLFSQLRPVFFLNKLDLSLNLLFLTGIQSTVSNNHYLQLLLDIVYLVLPLLLVVSVNRKAQVYMAILHSL
ncbi:MAG TPA: hypothetical protein VK484_13205, partial [Ferruginibacter sp.]|nr:hypothetical protein [Ferruginibacter sp.]